MLDCRLYELISKLVEVAVRERKNELSSFLTLAGKEQHLDRWIATSGLLTSLQEFDECREYLGKLPSVMQRLPIFKHLLPMHGQSFSLEDLLCLFMSQYLLINNTLTFDNETFQNIYDKIERVILSGSITYKALAPLAYFIPSADFELTERIKIRSINTTDKDLLEKNDSCK
jgi:hypothetical protein